MRKQIFGTFVCFLMVLSLIGQDTKVAKKALTAFTTLIKVIKKNLPKR